MKTLFKIYRGFHIYVWTTGKLEAYRWNGESTGMATLRCDYEGLKRMIDDKLED